MTDPILRKSTTGEPTTNPGQFGTHTHHAPEAVLPSATRPVEITEDTESWWAARARDVHTPAVVLGSMAGTGNSTVNEALAGNPYTPPEALDTLASNADFVVRDAVAQNRHADGDTLRRLSRDSVASVRVSVAANTSTPAEVLRGMYDFGADQRRPIVMNPSAPEDLVVRAADSADSFERAAVLCRNDVTEERIQRGINDPSSQVRSAAALNTRDPATLASLVNSIDPLVRAALCRNPLVTDDILTELQTDPNDIVRTNVQSVRHIRIRQAARR